MYQPSTTTQGGEAYKGCSNQVYIPPNGPSTGLKPRTTICAATQRPTPVPGIKMQTSTTTVTSTWWYSIPRVSAKVSQMFVATQASRSTSGGQHHQKPPSGTQGQEQHHTEKWSNIQVQV